MLRRTAIMGIEIARINSRLASGVLMPSDFGGRLVIVLGCAESELM